MFKQFELIRVLTDWETRFPFKDLAAHGTKWTFVTPGAPFKCGIWAAAVNSFKHNELNLNVSYECENYIQYAC